MPLPAVMLPRRVEDPLHEAAALEVEERALEAVGLQWLERFGLGLTKLAQGLGPSRRLHHRELLCCRQSWKKGD